MVGDVGHEVRVRAVALAHDAVLVVAEVGGAQPQRALRLIRVARLLQQLHGLVDLAVGVERALEEVGIEVDAEGAQVDVLLVAQVLHRELAHLVEIVAVHVAGMRRDVLPRDLADVLAVVAVLGHLGALARGLPDARLHREREVHDLVAGVVVVELARDRVALPFEERGDHVAQRRLAAVAHVQRPGGIGGHELHHELLPAPRRRAPVRAGLRVDRLQDAEARLGGEREVDEAGARDVDPGEERGGTDRGDDGGRHVARLLAHAPGDLQRDVGREISMVHVLRTLDQHGDFPRRGKRPGDGALHEAFDLRFRLGCGHGLAIGENERLYGEGL